MTGTKRRSTRQAATRKRSIYLDPDTDDDFEAASDGAEEFQPDEPVASPPFKKRKTAMRRKPQTRSSVKSKQTARSIKSSFRVGKPRKINSKTITENRKEFAGPSDNRIPKWSSLPVDILRDIFVYASQPIHENTNEAGTNVSWLLHTARTCRAFALPALEAYYQSPAMLTSLHPHHFLDLLRMPKEKRYIDYNVKVHSLQINIRILAYVAYNKPSFDLGALVTHLPQLQHMEIMHPIYLPPYRPLNIQRWTFPPSELFDIMDEREIRLKSWRWSRDMIPKNAFLDLYGAMTAAHNRQVFSHLERLVVCGFNYEDSSEPAVDENGDISPGGTIVTPPGLATSINKLPALKDLTFISCDVIMDKFLQRLPTNLQRLELSNCLEITSDMMRAFFKTSASQLRELVLNHNAALSLSFLTGLKMSCPRLEVLKVDMHYYSEKFTVNDAEAFYDELLSENEVPTWPTTLKHLVLVHAQKWTPEAAQNLFRSLLDSASELLDLRQLILHAHINIPWRDRVGFRDQWIERLRRVYLRQSETPFKNLGSLRQYRLWKQAQNMDANLSGDVDELGQKYTDDNLPSAHKLSHVRISPHKPSGDIEAYTDSEANSTPVNSQPRRSKRVADSQIVQVSKSTTERSETESEDDDDQPDWRKGPEKFIQGMCNVVDVRIDNQRPRENQFTVVDFLDSEISGDEDWHEGADVAEESYAW